MSNNAASNNTASKTWRVAVIGLSPAGLYYLERLGLFSEIRLAGVFDPDPNRLKMAARCGCAVSDQPISLDLPKETEALFFVDDIRADMIAAAIHGGYHVVIHRPWRLTSRELRTLNDLVSSTAAVVTTASLRRWSADFVTAKSANQSGRMGRLTSARFSSYEKRVPGEATSVGVLREFGYHWLDQLLNLIKSKPTRVFGQRLVDVGPTSDCGFQATIDFADGCTAQIDINTKSRLGYRTGWMLEGESGSYRNDRLYTETTDGEIVDEPIHGAPLLHDDFISDLLAAWRGEQASLPTLAEAVCVIQLIEAIEKSAQSGEVVVL